MDLKHVLVTGVGPIPPHDPPRLYAPGLRLWSFADTIEKSGHKVILCEAAFADQQEQTKISSKTFKNRRITHSIISLNTQAAAQELQKICSLHKPDCVVSSTDVINAAVVLARLPVPCWLDFFGHPVAERQMLAEVFDSDEGVIDQWNTVLPSLLGGDHFSVCSEAQKAALIGELGACGRLNKFTADRDIVDVILPALVMEVSKGSKGAIRGKLVGDDILVVLYTGGYNTWMDEETLFKALVYAMKSDSKIHFVSTGGEIKGHNEKTFEEFRKRVNSSKLKDHFHFCGWVPTGEVQDYYVEADVAVNVDRFSYEGYFGTRNRVIEWAAAGLPVITTSLSETTCDLVANNLVETFDFGDWKALGDQIIDVAKDPPGHRLKATRAQEYVLNKYETARVTKPLIEWIKSPEPAPDLPVPKSRPRLEAPVCPYNTLSRFMAESYRNRETVLSVLNQSNQSDEPSLPRRLISKIKSVLK